MSREPTITAAEHRRQIELFAQERPAYEAYAEALKRVLTKACAASLPEALIQSRAKALSSFAEKCVRKYAKYKDPVHQLTDLCGARVIVHTLDHVQAVRAFVRCNFEVLEEDEKGLSLGEDKFGYRDLHFLIRLNRARAAAIGFEADEVERIGQRVAELQVRTLVQHAWADILHDRMYKTKLIYPPDFQREGSLLAAIMEDGDRQFNALADDIDGMLTNFNVYVPREEVEKEIAVHELIHANAVEGKKAASALALARLLAAKGEYGSVCRTLEPHTQTEDGALRQDLLLELGFAQCKANLAAPLSASYQTGQRHLEEVVRNCRVEALDCVPNLRKRTSLLARALTRLAWSFEHVRGGAHLARQYYLEALREEPGNPYYLSEALAFEIECTRNSDRVGTMESVVRTAIATCDQHAQNGTELPYAYFTAGRLRLLLGQSNRGVVDYALGIRHLRAGNICVPPDVLEQERRWLYRVAGPSAPAEGLKWALDLIDLFEKAGSGGRPSAAPAPLEAPVAIVAGSAGNGLSEADADRLTECLKPAVAGTRGTLVSGGTRAGLSRCLADAVEWAAAGGQQVPRLRGYLPRSLSIDVAPDPRYDLVPCGEHDFSPEQVLGYWRDILTWGIQPSSVTLFGYGGGELSAVEYAVALLFDAQVFLVRGSGRAADDFLKFEAGTPNLRGLPNDGASIRALFRAACGAPSPVAQECLTKMAQGFHARYVAENQGKIPENVRPWSQLNETYVRANVEQARYAAGILESCGFGVAPLADPGTALSAADLAPWVEAMSELEHGRWSVDRLADGWRLGPRDNSRKVHDCLVPWSELPDDIREWDRRAIRNYPDIFASVGLKIVKRG